MESSRRILITVLIITAILWSTKICSASSQKTNLTETTLEDDEDPISLSENTSFRERYRRLIPYMTYYVSNNYVIPQSQSPPSYQSRNPSQNIKRRFHYSGSRISNPTSNVLGNNLIKNNNNNNVKNGNQYYVSPVIQQDRFIPSVQYDPKDMDNEDYFTPVIHNAKLNFEDYQAMLYQRYRTPRPTLIQSTTSAAVSNLHTEQQQLHFTTISPTAINFTPKYGDILVRKEAPKLPAVTKQNLGTNLYQRPTQRPTQRPYKFDQEKEQAFFTNEFEPLRFPRPQTPEPFRLADQTQYSRPRKPNVNLNHIVKSLQLTNQLPEVLNAGNIDESIKTLVEILGLLNNGAKNEVPFRQALAPVNTSPKYGDYEHYENRNIRPNIQTKRPFEGISRPIVVQDEIQPDIRPELNNGPYHVNIIDVGSREYPTTEIHSVEQSDKPNFIESTTQNNNYKINEELPENVLEHDEMITIPLTTEEPAVNYPPPDGASSHTQNFPPTSVKYGATRGKPDVDYPAYATIPKTVFSCTTQRYKGFFGDPDTGCQVWHYCDLNGGKSSFLCPNGTIFSQVALTCDWWFNVKCESTTQLYVLNERLYKYILPVMPKFPEDFSGPEVDRYLELKFKEMETKLKEKKLRKHEEDLKKVKDTGPQVQIDSSDIE